MENYIIYKITNNITKKVYIGKTTRDLDTRFYEHSINRSGCKSAVHDSMKKYGVENFSIEEIDRCSLKELNARERYWIAKYESYGKGYNLTPGGDGISLPDETIQQIRFLWEQGYSVIEISEELDLSRSTVYHRICKYPDYDPEENKRRALKPQEKEIFQYDLNGNFIQKYRSIHEAARALGVRATAISAAYLKGHVCHGYLWGLEGQLVGQKTTKKVVYQYDKQGNLIAEHSGAREAARNIGADSAGIIKCCNGQQQTCKGYKWSYEKTN